ncbi:MAG TPA: arginase family protein [Actinomycetaceae bacterium]|nr:arginase family protein [Actinomycetaceae bacterium]
MIETLKHTDAAQTLRLVWPQWQGAGRDGVAELLPGLPLEEARRGYAVGSRVLEAILPEHHGPTEIVPVPDTESSSTNGVESRQQIIDSLTAAQKAISAHDADRILTLGGECSVSVAPFAALAQKYGDDLAVVWIDAHPDTDTADTGYDGYHAMAVSTLLGRGDPEITGMLPATIDASRLALAGLHDWVEDAYANVGKWGLPTFAPDDLRTSSETLLDWLAQTGATKVAIHLDVDVVDSDEAALGLGRVPGGLTRAEVQRVVADLAGAAEVVGLTLAEFIPRDVLALRGLITGMPLVDRDEPEPSQHG